MRHLFSLVIVLGIVLATAPARGQAAQGWGGTAVPEAVPYQPTLPPRPPAYPNGYQPPAEAASTPGAPAAATTHSTPALAGPSFAPPPLSAPSAASSPSAPTMLAPYPNDIGPVPYPEVYSPSEPFSASDLLPASPLWDPAVLTAQAPSLNGGGPTSLANDTTNGDSLLPPGTRNGFFQKLKFTATWIPQLEDDGMGFSDMRTSAVFGLPFPDRERPLVIEPEYRVHFVEGPVGTDLPSRLNDAQIQFRHFRRLGGNWIFDGVLTYGRYADDYNMESADAERITGRAVFVYERGEYWKYILGAVYLDGAGYELLPVVGVAFHTDWVEYDLVFPRARAAWMLPGSIPDVDENWVYVMAEFGGGIWAITHPNSGTQDVMTMSDYRVVFGCERKVTGGVSRFFEGGYIFNRDLEFDHAPDLSLDDTFFLRTGLSY